MTVIEGEQLSSVEFVQDYVQLRFDGPCLTAITRPIIKLGALQLNWAAPGYRDALCERIGKVVDSVSVKEKEAGNILLSSCITSDKATRNDGMFSELAAMESDHPSGRSHLFAVCGYWLAKARSENLRNVLR